MQDESTENGVTSVKLQVVGETAEEGMDRVVGTETPDVPQHVLAANAVLTEAKRCRDERADDVKAAKADLKQAQDRYEAAVQELQDAIAGQQRFDFDDPATNPDDIDADAWRAVPLASLQGLTPALVRNLAEAGIGTLGELATYERTGELSSVKGLGPKAMEKLSSALDEFWAANPAYTQAATEAEGAPALGDATAGAEPATSQEADLVS